MANFQIFTDSCSDLPTSIRKERGIRYFHMGLVVDGKEYTADLDWIAYHPEEFYKWLSEGRKVKTTQVSYEEFLSNMKPLLQAGIDILYLACSSTLTGSMNVFNIVKDELQEQFPDRKMLCVDTLTASCCEGMLVLDAKKQQDKGASIEEVAKWVEDHKFFYNQFATVDTLKYLKDAGRIKGTAAFFGDIIGVKPIFISDRKGNNLVIAKVRGTKASLDALYKGIVDTIDKDNCKQVIIGQGMCMDRALLLKKRIEENLHIPAIITWIGPIVGTTCGPGVIATFCYGKEVTRFEGDGK